MNTGPSFDLSRANLKGPDLFLRYQVPAQGQSLRVCGLADDVELLLVERGGERRALLMRELAYHHVAQGELAGEPYLVSF